MDEKNMHSNGMDDTEAEYVTDAEILQVCSVYTKVRDVMKSELFLGAGIILTVGRCIATFSSGGLASVSLLMSVCLIWLYCLAKQNDYKKIVTCFSAMSYYFIFMAVITLLAFVVFIVGGIFLTNEWGRQLVSVRQELELAFLSLYGMNFLAVLISAVVIVFTILGSIASLIGYVVFFFKMRKFIKCIKGDEPTKVPCVAFIVLLWLFTVINLDLLMVLGNALLTFLLLRLQKALKVN